MAEKKFNPLRELRKQDDLPLSAVAKGSGVSIGILSMIERGHKPKKATMIKIERFLGVSN